MVNRRRFGFRFSLRLSLRLALGLLCLRRFHRQRPAREHHALRRGKPALRQRVFVSGIDLNARHLARSAVRVEAQRDRRGHRNVREPGAVLSHRLGGVAGHAVLLDGVVHFAAFAVHRHAGEAPGPDVIRSLCRILGFRRVVGVRFRLGFCTLCSLAFGFIVRRNIQQLGARTVRRHRQRADDLAVCQQTHRHALRARFRVAVVLPNDAAVHVHGLRSVDVGHDKARFLRLVRGGHLRVGAAIALDLVFREGVRDDLAVLIGRDLAEIKLPFILRGDGLAVELLLTVHQAQGHALGPQAVAVLVVVPADRAGRRDGRLRRVHQRQHQAGRDQRLEVDFFFLVGHFRGFGALHLIAIALGGVRTALGFGVDVLPYGNDPLHVARQHSAPAFLGCHGLDVHMSGILVWIHLQLQRVGAQAVCVVHVLPDDVHGGLAVRQPLACECHVLHYDERLAGHVRLVGGLARRVPALESAAGLGLIVDVQALRQGDFSTLDQPEGALALLFDFSFRHLAFLGILGCLRRFRRLGGLFYGRDARLRVLLVQPRLQVGGAEAGIDGHGHVVHVIEVRPPHHGRLAGGRAIDGHPAAVIAVLVEHAAFSEHRGIDDLRVAQGCSQRKPARPVFVRAVGARLIDQVQVRSHVRRHLDAAVLEIEVNSVVEYRVRIVLIRAGRGFADILAAHIIVLYAAKRAHALRDDLAAAILQLGIVGHVLTEDAVLHVQVGFAGGGVDLRGELLQILLGAILDGGKIVFIGRLHREVQDDDFRGMLPQELLHPIEHRAELQGIPVPVTSPNGTDGNAGFLDLAVAHPQVLSVVHLVDVQAAPTRRLVAVVHAKVDVAIARVELLVDVQILRARVALHADQGRRRRERV